MPILKDAYAIRTTLAEKDIYRNLEIYLATLHTPFQPSCMTATYRAYTDIKELNTRLWAEDYVVGNVAFGLEADDDQHYDDGSTKTTVVLYPEVVVSYRKPFV